jgi:hypothetical protein
MFGPPLFVPETNTPLPFSASLNGGTDLAGNWEVGRSIQPYFDSAVLADRFRHSLVLPLDWQLTIPAKIETAN